MKKIVVCFIAILSCMLSVKSQTMNDIGRLCINVSPLSDNAIPAEAAKVLENRLHQIIAANGIAVNGIDKKFAIAANVITISKDVIGGMPTRISQKLEISIFVTDIVEKKEFGRVSLNAVGVGLNETKCYCMAFNTIKADNKQIVNMIDSAKDAIISYYRSNAQRLLKEAKSLADMGDYDEAIYLLSTIPNVCEKEYNDCQDIIYDIYKRKINHEGEILFMQAKAAWASSPNAEGAQNAISYLNDISVLATCNKDVKALLVEITEKIKQDQKAEWEFQLKKYEDEKVREQRDFEFAVRQYEDKKSEKALQYKEELEREKRDYEFAVRKYEDDVAYQRAVLDASKEVALAYAKQK